MATDLPLEGVMKKGKTHMALPFLITVQGMSY